MSENQEVYELLCGLKVLLQSEKSSLIDHNVEKLDDIVEKKHALAQRLEDTKGKTFQEEEKIRDLVREIRILQETNLMLTKQAMGFQNVVFRALGEGKNSKYKTYDAIGKISGKSDASIIDHSV